MGVPALESERGDAWSILSAHDAGRAFRNLFHPFGIIGAGVPLHAALKGGVNGNLIGIETLMQGQRKRGVAGGIKVEDTRGRVGAGPRNDRRRPAENWGWSTRDQGLDRSHAETSLPRNGLAFREGGHEAVEPSGRIDTRAWLPAFKDILTVEMGTLPVWGGHGMDHQGLTFLVEPGEVRH